MVNRRKFVIGLGALVAGSGAALGTGASVSSTMDRDANVNVVNDTNGLVALESKTASDVVREANGELLIDFTADSSASGLNIDSRYQVGDVKPDTNRPARVDPVGGTGVVYTNPAFTITNHDTVTKELTVSYEVNSGNTLYQDGSFLYIDIRGPDSSYVDGSNVGSGGPGTLDSEFFVDHDNRQNSFTFDDGAAITSGGTLGVSLFVDTTGPGASTDEDLGGTLTISTETA
jgi:hypothetical protein